MLRFRNFLSYGNNYTEIDLSTDGMHHIHGSNGVGKSTIPLALAFGLFGKTDRGNKKGQLVNSINKKELEVIIEFQKGNDQYRVRRGIKPSIFEIHKNGKLVDQNAASRDYQTYFENEILNLNYKTFYQTIILSSSSFTPFMQLTPAARREVIEDLLDISIFSKMRLVLKERLDDNKNSLMEVETLIKTQKEKIGQYREYRRMIDSKNEERKNELNERIKNNKKKMKEIASEILEINQRMKSLTDELIEKKRDHENHRATYDKNKIELRASMNEIKKRLEFFENTDKCPTCDQTIDNETKERNKKQEKQKANNAKSMMDFIEDLKKVIDEENEKIEAHQKEYNELFSSNQVNMFQVSSLESENNDLENELKRLEGDHDGGCDGSYWQKGMGEEELRSELFQMEERRTKEMENQIYLLSIQEMLKDNGMKGVMIRRYLPIINKLLNQYLTAMDFFVLFHLDENFNETVKSRHRDHFSYSNFSEGEKARLNLAILFTWRQIARMKNSTSCNLLFLDEVFSSVLDRAGSEQLVEILLNESETQKNSIFVISHSQDLQNSVEFERKYLISKEKNFSKVSVLE